MGVLVTSLVATAAFCQGAMLGLLGSAALACAYRAQRRRREDAEEGESPPRARRQGGGPKPKANGGGKARGGSAG